MVDIKMVFQTLSTFTILGVLYLQIKQLYITKENIGYVLATMIWMLHALTFYFFVFLYNNGIYNLFDIIPSNAWSSGLRFHGYAIIFSLELSRYQLLKLKNKLGVTSGENDSE